jgi:multiple sugar transport system permease protein
MGPGRWNQMRRQKNAYLFISPFYIMFLCFLLFPIAFSFFLSFRRWNGIMASEFAGLANYRSILEDPAFLNALKNTCIFTLLTVSASMVISLALALFLNTVRVFKRFYRAVFFVPAFVSLVVVSLVWKLILNSDVGLIREMLDGLARTMMNNMGWAPHWLTARFRLLDNPNPIVPLLTITLVNVWAVVGFNTVIYLAGLQGIPSYMYEASRIDGATKFQNFRYITWPLLRPTTFFVVLMSTIDALQVFVLPNVMKRDSEATMTVVYYLYRNAFQFYNMGYASAIAYVLFALTALLGVLLRFTLGRKASWTLAE